MKKLIVTLCALSLLLCGCSPAPAVPDTPAPSGSEPADEGFLPTAYAQRADDGSYSLTVDADGDGTEELFRLTPAREDAGPEYYVATLDVSRDGNGLDDAVVDGYYPQALAAADLDGDDCLELLVSCDYASEDYATSLYRLEDDRLVYCGTTVGCLQNAANGAVTLKWYDHPFGTWWLYCDYIIGESGRALSQSGDLYILPGDYGWGQSQDDDSSAGFPVLTEPLEVRTADGRVTLEAGTMLIPTRCDYTSYVDLLTADGLACSIDVRYVADELGIEQVMVVLPDGTERNIDDIFSDIPYWG